MRVIILGISAFYHDSAAALIKDGDIVAAAQEERFTRKKHDFRFPNHAIDYCLREGGLKASQLDYVVFYDKPFLKFERILDTYLQYAPVGIFSFLKAIPLWIKQKLWMKSLIADELKGYEGDILFPEHHLSHAASAFYPSPFMEAAIITTDGVGEWTTTSIGVGNGNKINILKEIHFPHSLGMLYSAFTYYTGFKVNSAEYKVMGLAPYGEPRYVQKILDHLIDIKEDGSFRLNMHYFNYAAGLTMTNNRFAELFGGPARKPETLLTQKEMDLARSVQEVTEMVILRMARFARQLVSKKNLCLAGGVALNCVANGKILREGIFENLWIQPAAGDAGGALGAALAVWYDHLNNQRQANDVDDFQKGSFLGPHYESHDILQFLENHKLPYKKLTREELPKVAAKLLTEENVIGWFQGRMEFGPRALGARSIIGDARSPRMQKKMNLKIKFRESFRPFAPSVLDDQVSNFFEFEGQSPYMLMVADVKKEIRRQMTPEEKQLFGIDKLNVKRSEIPAVTHVDYSARLQTVHKQTNPLYYDMIKAFYDLSGCPVIVNTSFNVRGEPIVCKPIDAYKCFMRTEIDYLFLGDFLLDKSNQPEFVDEINWQEKFELD
ncbi:carbamoyltransferase [candidate division KSB1 bacterium]|nr:carbamoyltransferase [candidate division KSB1 bacterium]